MNCGNPTANLTLTSKFYLSGSEPPSTIYLSSIILKCLIGFRFSDGSLTQNSQCDQTGKWSSTVSCDGKILVKNFNKKF